jgi:hypothetical protein
MNFIMLSMSAQQVNDFSNIFGALVMRRAADVVALSNGFDRDLGFRLHDGDVTYECHLRGKAGCEVLRHSRRIGKGVGVVQHHLELSEVTILARDQIHDQRALGSCECSEKRYLLTVE